MRDATDATKPERLAEFLRRLRMTPAASDFNEAYCQLCDILNAVEDEMTSIPFDMANWQSNGRMYPPLRDSLRAVPGRIDVETIPSQVSQHADRHQRGHRDPRFVEPSHLLQARRRCPRNLSAKGGGHESDRETS